MEGRKTKKQRLFEGMRTFIIKNEMPCCPPSGYRIEILGQKDRSRVLVSGARRILVCESEQVILKIKERQIRFHGVGLECLCYEGGVAEISGDIRGFSLSGADGV